MRLVLNDWQDCIPLTIADERIDWLSAGAAISSISIVGICIGLGVPLLSVLLEQRGYSATMIGLNTAFAGVAALATAPLASPTRRAHRRSPCNVDRLRNSSVSFALFQCSIRSPHGACSVCLCMEP